MCLWPAVNSVLRNNQDSLISLLTVFITPLETALGEVSPNSSNPWQLGVWVFKHFALTYTTHNTVITKAQLSDGINDFSTQLAELWDGEFDDSERKQLLMLACVNMLERLQLDSEQHMGLEELDVLRESMVV